VLAPVSAALLSIAAICTQAAPAWSEDVKATKTRKPPSVCVGLEESACGTKSECYWRKAVLTKTGKTRKAHCRIKRSAAKSAPA
jgi:hypothetical protein